MIMLEIIQTRKMSVVTSVIYISKHHLINIERKFVVSHDSKSSSNCINNFSIVIHMQNTKMKK